MFFTQLLVDFLPTKRAIRMLSRTKSKKYLKYHVSNILHMTNMSGAFIFGNEF